MPYKILVACEESQRVCAAFRSLGHLAFSCDVQPCSGNHPEWHILGDCLPVLDGDVDFRTQSGDAYRKRTCLWLHNLPLITPTDVVPYDCYTYKARSGRIRTEVRWRGQGPTDDWGKNRSKTFPGIAKAIAAQFSAHLESEKYQTQSTLERIISE